MDSESLSDTVDRAFAAATTAPEPTSTPEPSSGTDIGAPPPALTGTGTATTPPDKGEETRTLLGQPRAPDGKFARKDGTAPPLKADAPAVTEVAPAVAKPVTSEAAPPIEGATTATLKAPQSWKPLAREKWNALPPEVQAEVLRVEQDTKRALSESTESRKTWAPMAEAVKPYETLFRSEGMDPATGVAQLSNAYAILRTGPMPARTQVLATLIRAAGATPESINAEVERMGGWGDPQNPQSQPQQPQQFAQQDFQQMLRQELAQMAAQAQDQRMRTELESFGSTAEFWGDVKETVGLMLQSAHARGETIPLKQAYDRACRANDEVWPILEQRKAAEAAKASQAQAQQQRTSSSSVKSQPAAVRNGKAGVESLDETIDRAMAAVRSR